MPQIAITLAITAGGMALQYLLTPRVKQEPTDRGKMDDVRFQGNDYGAIIPWTNGRVRLAGNLVIGAGTQHYTVEPTRGGGKKSPPTEITHIYKGSFGILITRSPTNAFLRIWEDADLINVDGDVYSEAFEAEAGAFVALSGGAAPYSDAGASGGTAVEGLGNGGKAELDCSSVEDPPVPPSQDPDEIAYPHTRIVFYYKCATDLDAEITLNGTTTETVTFPHTDEWTAKTIIVPGFVDTVLYENPSSDAPDLDKFFIEKYWEIEPFPRGRGYQITGIVNPNIGYPTDLNDPGEYYNYPSASVKDGGTGTYSITTPIPGEEIRFYTGTETQTPDSKLISWLDERYGAGQGELRASAMRGQTWVMFENRTLRSNRPGNFTFEIDSNDNTLNTVLEHLMEECGLSSDDYDLSATSALTQVGFIDNQRTSRKSLIESLSRYHFFRLAEYDGKIHTVLDSPTPSAALNADDIRAHYDSEPVPDREAEIAFADPLQLPREVRVSVMQPELEYHNEPLPARLFADVKGREVVDYAMPIVDPASAARLVAEKLILKAHSENRAIEFFAMPNVAKYTIGTVLTIPINGRNYNIRIEKRRMQLPIGVLQIQGVIVSPFAPSYYQDTVTELASKALGQFAQSSFPRNSIAFVIESEPIRTEDKNKLGVYLALCGRGRGVGDNIALYREMAEDDYAFQEIAATPSPVGICVDALGSHSTPTTEDASNSLDIYFFDEVTLQSVSADDIARSPHINLIRVGDEWLQFRTVTPQTLDDGSPYRTKVTISNLMRGRFNTTSAIGSHAAGEYAAVVTPSLMFYELDPADVGEVVNLKAVTNGQSVEVAPISSFTFVGDGAVAPVIGQVMDAEQLAIRIGIRNYSENIAYRKIEISENADMSSADEVTVTADEFSASILPTDFLLTRASGTGNVTRYVRISHSWNGETYGTPSNILTVTFADNLGAGGSSGSFSPNLDYTVQI